MGEDTEEDMEETEESEGSSFEDDSQLESEEDESQLESGEEMEESEKECNESDEKSSPKKEYGEVGPGVDWVHAMKRVCRACKSDMPFEYCPKCCGHCGHALADPVN